MSSTNFAPHEVVLLPIPFADLTSSKVRPAIVNGRMSPYDDLVVLPVTSRLSILPTEYRLKDWSQCGLNVASAIEPHLATVSSDRVVRKIGMLSPADRAKVAKLLGSWLGEALKVGSSPEPGKSTS